MEAITAGGLMASWEGKWRGRSSARPNREEKARWWRLGMTRGSHWAVREGAGPAYR